MRGPNKKLTPFGKLVVKARRPGHDKGGARRRSGRSTPVFELYLNGTRSGGKYLPAIVAALELDPRKVEKAIAA